MRYFFTADLHLWHSNILVLAGRPFVSIEAHNQAIQDGINDVVTPSDCLVILGDLAFGKPERLSKWLDGLRTKKLHLVWGNHDGTAESLVKREPMRFQRVGDKLEYQIQWPGREWVKLFCSHYAHRVWNKSHHGSYHLYGHSHGSLPDDPHARSMDVGVDTNRYRPWALEDIIARLDQRDFKAIDHHNPDLHRYSDKTVCSLCNIIKYYHECQTLRCPAPGTTGSGIRYHKTQYFAPKFPEPWLMEALGDAKKAYADRPDWAK